MKLKKRILTEELGLPTDRKKSYTTDRKQKVMLSENQLQRLLSRLSEQRNKPSTSPKAGYKCYKCAEGGPVGYNSYKPCPKAHSNIKALKCCCKMSDGSIVPPQSVGNQGIVCPKSGTPVKCKSPSQTPVTRYRIDAGGCLACTPGSPVSACPYTEPTCGGQSNNNNVQQQCCTDPQGNQTTVTNCSSCPPFSVCGACTPMSESIKNNKNMRTLRTTNPITEGEIKNIKSMMSRMTTAGKSYNPVTITEEDKERDRDWRPGPTNPNEGKGGSAEISLDDIEGGIDNAMSMGWPGTREELRTAINKADSSPGAGQNLSGSISAKKATELSEDWEYKFSPSKEGGTVTVTWTFSDSRLKKNIRRVGKSNRGINIYEFEYKNKSRYGSGMYRGVMAEEIQGNAVKRHENGYLMVDYSKLDVNFERLSSR